MVFDNGRVLGVFCIAISAMWMIEHLVLGHCDRQSKQPEIQLRGSALLCDGRSDDMLHIVCLQGKMEKDGTE